MVTQVLPLQHHSCHLYSTTGAALGEDVAPVEERPLLQRKGCTKLTKFEI